MLAPEIGSTNDGPVSVSSVPPANTPVVTTMNEKAPLISKRRFLSSISSAFGFGSTRTISSGGYVEFGATDVEPGRTLGTFAGVFSPVALSMFSALLFLRVGFIVGNAGLWMTLLQFVIAYGILLFTVASVCAVSTNGAVEGGGAYFMISRTLGPEFGGSIGTLFFLANLVSSALYITGCAEGIVENFGTSGYIVGEGSVGLPDGRWWRFLYCSFLNVLSLMVCLIGAGMFAKTSVVVLGIVCISLISVVISFCVQGPMLVSIPEENKLHRNGSEPEYANYTGFRVETLKDNWYQQYGLDYTSDGKAVDFATVFGVLFSGVTGIMAGANMSGSMLQFVVNGTWRGNPIAAVLTSWVLVELILLIGSLNTIAQINSVLFLLSYLATNLACLGLELASAPNFRPSFKYFTWHTASIGLLGTLVMMFLINSIYASTSIVLCLVLVIILHLFSPSREAHWGSISQALIFHQVRKYLLLLDSRKDHVKFWRPQMLLLVGNPRSSCPLIHFVNDLKKGGLYVLGHIKVGQLSGMEVDPTLDEYSHWLTLVDKLKVKAFIELTVARSVREGLQHMIRMSGLGAMKPNTIILGFFDEELPHDFFEDGGSLYSTDAFRDAYTNDGRNVFALRSSTNEKVLDAIEYVGMVSDTLKMRKNVCLCRHFHALDKRLISKSSDIQYIDVWPVNFFNPDDEDPFDTTSLFMLQLACIINMVPGWKNLHLRVFLCEKYQQQDDVSSNNSAGVPSQRNIHRLRQLLQMLRIAATIHEVHGWGQKVSALRGGSVMQQTSAYMKSSMEDSYGSSHLDNAVRVYLLSVNQLLRQHSERTAASFLYLPVPPDGDEASVYPTFLQLLTELTADLPPIVLVHGVSAVTSTTL
ncbi:solute carrier family 12 member 9 isoform X3 [Periplaneta americana]|uniref:solute carrier family 12 member 9 isoform X3 n=1 Tax=Periplaneta americana TaxID=6978 RepID=UPI0037E80F0A